ncbi:unnamed protein product [Jaminaea pallidilutea]
MAGPNLEVFKFGLYLFFPLAIMIHYGDPDWYRNNVLPIRDQFWPDERRLFRPPRNESDLKSTLDDMKEVRLARREARLKREQQGGTSVSGTEAAPSTTNTPTARDRIRSVAPSAWSPSLWLPQRDRDVEGWRRADKERMV